MAARQQLSDVSTHNHSLFEKVQNFENEVEQMSKIRELNDQERVTIADERNAISDRAIQLESEIIEHIQGRYYHTPSKMAQSKPSGLKVLV